MELSSKLNIKNTGTEALIEICKKVNSNQYISGKDGKKYLDLSKFNERNIKVEFQNYQHPKYNQNLGDFELYMCILDLLFNGGPNSLKIIKDECKYESEC